MLPEINVSSDATALILTAISDFRCAHSSPPGTFLSKQEAEGHPSQTPLVWKPWAKSFPVTKMGSCSPNPSRSLGTAEFRLPRPCGRTSLCYCVLRGKWTFHTLPQAVWCNGYVLGKEYSSSDIIITMAITHGKLTSLARHSLYPLYHWGQQWV